jgi:SH3 domain protein
MKFKSNLLLFALLISSFYVSAETLYVTDRILLGVHQEAAETSPVIATIPSGTAVTVVERGDDFTNVKLADGKQGWVSSGYLKQEKPAAAELDTAYAKLKKAQETTKKLSDELDKKERESQVRRDELSNAKTTIKELQTALKEQGTANPSADTAASKESEEQIKALQEQVNKLNEEKAALAAQSKSDSVMSLHELQNQNQELQVRIEAALANLKGDKVPSPSELAAIRPSFPFWYWILLIALFIAGIAAGIGWFDFHYRKRHGGFRI